jgi:hypothetical protein
MWGVGRGGECHGEWWGTSSWHGPDPEAVIMACEKNHGVEECGRGGAWAYTQGLVDGRRAAIKHFWNAFHVHAK